MHCTHQYVQRSIGYVEGLCEEIIFTRNTYHAVIEREAIGLIVLLRPRLLVQSRRDPHCTPRCRVDGEDPVHAPWCESHQMKICGRDLRALEIPQ
jgi:hypothetical protein